MATGIKHTLLRELQLQMRAYDYRVASGRKPVSPERVLEVARRVADNYAEVRRSRNADHAEYNRERWADRAAQGLCRRCGKAPPRTNRASCEECGERYRLDNKRRYEDRTQRLEQVRQQFSREA